LTPHPPGLPRRSVLAALATLCAGSGAGPGARAASGPFRLRFAIDLSALVASGRFNPAAETVGVRGNAAPLSWARTLRAQRGSEPGWYELTLELPALPFGGQPLAYKFKIEPAGAADQPDRGWEDGGNRLLLPDAPQVTVTRAFDSAQPVPTLRRTGRIDRIAPQPSRHVQPREVQVWLPPGYDDSTAATPRLPVLYLHDGQNVFDWQASGGEWMADETADRLIHAGTLPPFIVVGVASTASRIHDYTPWPDRQAVGGGAAAYGRYLVEELKPLVDARYRTLPAREHTALGGSSLGGLVTMWLLLEHAATFGAGLVVSPSVWWAGRAIVQQVRDHRGALPARVWLCMGEGEGTGMMNAAKSLAEALHERGISHRFVQDPEGGHDEPSWARRLEAMLLDVIPRIAPTRPR
jgi:predicted alpha/beta superfamily hydrolase